jgi:hypothetical protein
MSNLAISFVFLLTILLAGVAIGWWLCQLFTEPRVIERLVDLQRVRAAKQPRVKGRFVKPVTFQDVPSDGDDSDSVESSLCR